MQVNAEIDLGSRSVIGYLLSPIQKVALETGQEELARTQCLIFATGTQEAC